MPWFILYIIIPVVLILFFMNWRIRKTKMEHIQKIEQLKKTVVELVEKQLVLKEKVELADWFQESKNSNFEKLNKEVSGLFDLLMKMIETKERQNGKT
jgi:ABC-type multidrug transport system fused ATPase/permease subunit